MPRTPRGVRHRRPIPLPARGIERRSPRTSDLVGAFLGVLLLGALALAAAVVLAVGPAAP